MFRFHKTLDVLTLFHSPANPASVKVLNLLRTASEKATRSGILSKTPSPAFEVDIVEAPTIPTPDQFRSILEFLGPGKVGELVKGAHYDGEAYKMLKQGNAGSEMLIRPLLVDWNNGRAVAGADTKAVQNLIDTLPKN